MHMGANCFDGVFSVGFEFGSKVTRLFVCLFTPRDAGPLSAQGLNIILEHVSGVRVCHYGKAGRAPGSSTAVKKKGGDFSRCDLYTCSTW